MIGKHLVCAGDGRVSPLHKIGNDLSTPNLRYGFKGLKPGDRWCRARQDILKPKERELISK